MKIKRPFLQRQINKTECAERIPKSNKRLRAKLQLKKAVCSRLRLKAATKTKQATNKCEQKAQSSRPAINN